MAGKFLDSHLSKPLIKPFAEKNNIDLSICERDKISDYDNFNDFFTRQLKDGMRPIGQDETRLMAPCDGLLSAYVITEGLVIPVKRSCYKVSDLLHSKKLANEYNGGLCLVYEVSSPVNSILSVRVVLSDVTTSLLPSESVRVVPISGF